MNQTPTIPPAHQMGCKSRTLLGCTCRLELIGGTLTSTIRANCPIHGSANPTGMVPLPITSTRTFDKNSWLNFGHGEEGED